jgi:hypothetical protein
MGDINWVACLVPLARRGVDACGDCEDARSFRLTSAEVVLSWEVGSDSVGSSLLPSETKRFSRPSTRFKRASRTSVLGPLFLGTASGRGCQSMFGCTRVVLRVEHTVYTRAVEHLTGFTGRPCAIALDLDFRLARGHDEKSRQALPFAFDSFCSSWPRGARWRRGGRVVGRCQSAALPLRPVTGKLRWTWRRYRAVDQKHSLAASDVDDGELDGRKKKARSSTA